MRYILLAGGCAAVLLACHAIYRRLMRDCPDPALEIKAPTYRWTDHDEQLQQRTQKRRAVADGIRVNASRIETGTPQKRGDLRVMGNR